MMTIRKLFFALAICSCSVQAVQVTANSQPILVEWDSTEGQMRLQKSEAKDNFWKLVRYYESQTRGAYCGIASAVIALNALSIEAPPSQFFNNFRMFNQEEFFTDEIKSFITPEDVSQSGLSLSDLAEVLNTFPVSVAAFPAQQMTHQEIRSLLIAALKNPNQVVLVLFLRKILGQDGNGHWSPIAAYDASSDSFLLLDVARFKYPPTWVDATSLINAMQTSNVRGRSRGFIILEKLKRG